MNKLVSIVTPCYNGAPYLSRYAKSIIDQDYPNIQLIFMNDGSTDNSEEVILSYEKEFKEHGITLEYHRHENVGLGGTVAKGIKHIKGEYFIWFDQDDFLPPQSIIKRVNYLEQHPEYGVVRTTYKKVHNSDLSKTLVIGPENLTYEQKAKELLFEDYLVSRNMWLQPGCYMIRMAAFDRVNPDRYLYPSREGHD